MSGSYSSRLRAGASAGGGLGCTTVLAAKLVSGADAFLWKLYLFVTVHVIIFVIWKLSDYKHFNGAAHKDPWSPVPHHPAPTLLTKEVVLKSMNRKVEFAPAADVVRGEEFRVPPPVVSRTHLEAAASLVSDGVVSPSSRSVESCVTTEAEEDSASSAVAASAYVGVVNSRRNVAPAPSPVRALSLRPRQAMAATDEHFDGADHDDDLDATWNAIMERTRPATAPSLSTSPRAASRSSPRPRAREPSVGAAELSKRSEEFINKIHHSFGRQQ
uniref:Uncharacterized protein n=1 Tax=Avena sativa TaxID=4498 RepID=A0ACD5WML6_AVESA